MLMMSLAQIEPKLLIAACTLLVPSVQKAAWKIAETYNPAGAWHPVDVDVEYRQEDAHPESAAARKVCFFNFVYMCHGPVRGAHQRIGIGRNGAGRIAKKGDDENP